MKTSSISESGGGFGLGGRILESWVVVVKRRRGRAARRVMRGRASGMMGTFDHIIE
jgi:hypothetical protein